MEQHQASICYIVSIEILHHILVLSELFSYQWRCSQRCTEQKQEKDLKMVNW